MTLGRVQDRTETRGTEVIAPRQKRNGTWMHGWIFGRPGHNQCGVVFISEHRQAGRNTQWVIGKEFYGR